MSEHNGKIRIPIGRRRSDQNPNRFILGMEETLCLLALGSTSIAQRCDVSQASDVDELADVTYRTFGECAVLFNNAGAGAATLDDWTWTIGVNLMGVVDGIRAFIRHTIEQGREFTLSTQRQRLALSLQQSA